jgi:multiple RNA-binding domain-containing protein 1
MASSRIFVRNLPPTLSEDEFKAHFSKFSTPTDTRFFGSRRIGYVGYKTPEEAAKAVKYFNKSFIRMSRIGVEMARPVCPISKKGRKSSTVAHSFQGER